MGLLHPQRAEFQRITKKLIGYILTQLAYILLAQIVANGLHFGRPVFAFGQRLEQQQALRHKGQIVIRQVVVRVKDHLGQRQAHILRLVEQPVGLDHRAADKVARLQNTLLLRKIALHLRLHRLAGHRIQHLAVALLGQGGHALSVGLVPVGRRRWQSPVRLFQYLDIDERAEAAQQIGALLHPSVLQHTRQGQHAKAAVTIFREIDHCRAAFDLRPARNALAGTCHPLGHVKAQEHQGVYVFLLVKNRPLRRQAQAALLAQPHLDALDAAWRIIQSQ